MQKYIYYMVKIFDKSEFAESFLDGNLHCKKLSFFRNFDDETEGNRGDKHEGIVNWHKAEDVIIEINGMKIENVIGNVGIKLNSHDNINIFCIYASYSNEEIVITKETIPKLLEELKISNSCFGLGNEAVLITDVKEFVNRVCNASKDQKIDLKANLIEYYDPDVFSGKFDEDEAIFNKRIEYSHQKEYRFAFYPREITNDAMDLKIGSIRDIAFKIDPNEINSTMKIEIE